MQRNSQVERCLKMYGDGHSFLRKFNPDRQEEFCQKKNLDRCYIGLAPTLQTVVNTYGTKLAETWLEIQINNLQEYSAVKEKLTPLQIEAVGRTIITEYPHYKVTEFMHFFHMFKAGFFGKFYGTADSLVINEALLKYGDIRKSIIADIYYRQEKEKQERQFKERQEEAISYEEWQELKYLFNM